MASKGLLRTREKNPFHPEIYGEKRPVVVEKRRVRTETPVNRTRELYSSAMHSRAIMCPKFEIQL
jgi:hypothetical protein